MFNNDLSYQAADFVKQQLPKDFTPKVGLVLGSGLGDIVNEIDAVASIPYKDIPGFTATSVAGHAGNLIIGDYHGVKIACLQGRPHHYEGVPFSDIKTFIRTLKLLGCEYYLGTNAVGSIRKEFAPGDIVMITDHINFQGNNPLVGPNDDDFGVRFPPMHNAYDKDLRQLLSKTAQDNNIPLHQGVYISVLGPNFETAAEIRAFGLWGADVVGMSTVPAVIVATHCGLRNVVLSVVTNYATGLCDEVNTHELTMDKAALGGKKLMQLLKAFVPNL